MSNFTHKLTGRHISYEERFDHEPSKDEVSAFIQRARDAFDLLPYELCEFRHYVQRDWRGPFGYAAMSEYTPEYH